MSTRVQNPDLCQVDRDLLLAMGAEVSSMSPSRVEALRRDITKLMEVSDIDDLTAARDFLDARTNLAGLPN